jgi:hypothetical protein
MEVTFYLGFKKNFKKEKIFINVVQQFYFPRKKNNFSKVTRICLKIIRIKERLAIS